MQESKPNSEEYDLWQKVEWLFKNESFRQLLHEMFGFGEIPDDAVGWCSMLLKTATVDIEIYIDLLAFYTAGILKREGRFSEGALIDLLKIGLNFSLIHEFTHWATDETDEDRVNAAAIALLSGRWMTWSTIPCPKKEGEEVTWVECLACDDRQKHPSCPLRKIRIDAYPRQYEIGKYHVTELPFPRYSYYNRIYKYARSWDEYYDLLYGKALGWYIESKYAEHQREVTLDVPFTRDGETIRVVGHGDIVDDDVGNVYELKFYYSLKYIVERGTPNPEHEFQVRAYYTLGLLCKPWMFNKIQKIKMIYYSKLKGRKFPRRKEFVVPLEKVDVETNAWILHKALKTKVAPKELCPKWKCRYCPYKAICESEIT